MPPTRSNSKHRKYNRDAYYNPIPQYVVGNIILTLKNFDFQKITSKSVDDLAAQLVNAGMKDAGHILIPLGCYGIIDYDIRLQRLGSGSLNTEDSVDSRTSRHPSVVKLRFTNTMGVEGNGASTRLAIVLGRIVGPHQHKERLVQSRWIVLLDQTRLLWVVYANDIDEKDVAASKYGGPVPYSVNWDTAFGAQKQFGQKVILLGPLENIPFKVNKELPAPEIHAIGWSTTFVTIDESSSTSTPKLLVSAATVKRLLDTNTSFFTLPQYNNQNMAWLKNFLRYDQFCKNLDEVNKAEGLIIGRTLAEAAWCQVIVRAYKFMDEDIEQREGTAFQADLGCLSDCLAQRREESMFKYWLDKSIKYPGLDLVNTPDEDPTGDHLAGLAEWALTMLRENKNQGSTSFAFRCAVPPNAENVAVPQAQPIPATTMNMGRLPSNGRTKETTLVVRAKAENEGLVRTVKESVDANDV
ncbi:hypothetical protein BKA61DRAFT_688555 [Leptodontidium sp. MPI-SDFR-AT-0119]|nr:hypothetical protein BKA61DRAFT_688555 [Leptodontidium sp. MPI-SDFR-AT-0119]